jgi:flagellar basal-body rod protein FlgB
MNISFPDQWFNQLQHAMDVLSVQHKTIAGNLANVNTPGYRALQVNFNEELNRIMQGELSEADPLRPVANMVSPHQETNAVIQPSTDEQTPGRMDGNNVKLEKEMVNLSETNEMYALLARIANLRVRAERTVISGGRG